MPLKIVSIVLVLGVVALASCDRVAAPEHSMLDSTLAVPISTLNIPVYYPVEELEATANEKLKGKIIETGVALSDQGDSVFLAISRFKKLSLRYNGDQGITYTLPIQVEGHLDTKVAGIRIRNKTPIRAKIIVTLFSELDIKEDWNLITKTELKKIEWVEDPKIKIVGINFNLKHQIEKILKKNQGGIITKLDESIDELIKVRKTVEKIWVDIQKPIRVNRKHVPVWIKGDPVSMRGRFLARSKDTLMIQIGLHTRLNSIFDSSWAEAQALPLPAYKRKESDSSGIAAFIHVSIPFDLINSFINRATDTMKFTFASHHIQIKKSEVYATNKGIAIRLTTTGDIKTKLNLQGTLVYDSIRKKMIIADFGFDMDSEHSLLSTADWLVHDVIVSRIQPYLTLSFEDSFLAIPKLITQGIEKGKLGKKVNIEFSEFDFNIQEQLVTRNNLQLIARVRGQANVGLEKAAFNKTKKSS